jgi:formate hydrogenlyase transcriptional activator
MNTRARSDDTSNLSGVPEALREWEQLWAIHSSASNVGLCILDRTFHFLVVNPVLPEIDGIPAQAHLGKSVNDVFGSFAETIQFFLQEALDTGQPVLNREISLRLPTRLEASHWVGHFIPLKDETGNVARIGVVLVETTAQKKLEESYRNIAETLKDEKNRGSVLAEVGGLIEKEIDVRQSFPKVSAYLRRVLHQEYASLSLCDEKSWQLMRQAVDFPLRKDTTSNIEAGAANDPDSQALKSGTSLIFTRKEFSEIGSGITNHFLAEGLQSLCCVPLKRPKGPIGVLVLGSTRTDAFKADDLPLLNQVAAQLAIALENARTTQEVEELKSKLAGERQNLQGEISPRPHFEGIVGESRALKQVLDQVSIVAQSDATVLLLGETGTGKGLVARAIHGNGSRKSKPFVTLNCAAIPTGLLESELFGHEKGAFTGAVSQKMGRLEVADKGTLFLDEIGEIPIDLQPKLLRVLQDREFERLGGTRTMKVDLRLIAATNRNLARSVAEKEFRSDLFYRLNVFPLRIPPLRERREDIPILVRYFVRKFTAELGRDIESIPSEAMDALMCWGWPGNVREMENFIERSVILSEGSALHVPLSELEIDPVNVAAPSLESTERAYIIKILRETRGMLSGPNGAAQRLGVKRTTLQSKMERLGISRKNYMEPNSE